MKNQLSLFLIVMNKLKIPFVLVGLLLFITECGDNKSSKPGELVPSTTTDYPAKDFRYVICTDMTHDDDNSLIRLLHYANEIDIEAITVTDQGPETNKIENWPEKMWNRAMAIFEAYGQVVDNLRLHDPNFPSVEYFRSITKQGKGTAQRMTGSSDNGQEKFWDYVGEDWDSEASELLIKVFEKDDDRPIYIGFWGGSITFAQAMWRYQQNHSPSEVQALLDKMIFHCISFQDVTFDMFVDLDSIGKNIGTKKSFYGDYDGKRHYPRMLLADGNNFWKYIGAVNEDSIYKYSGPLGDLYDKGGEGDTPAFLNLIAMNRGLSHIENPEFGGWGDMFKKYGLKNVWVADHNKPEELMKWLPETTNSFYARCMWEENDYESCNHDPIAAFDSDSSPAFVYLSAKPGDKVSLSAQGSYDPDNDELKYSWFYYPEASSGKAEVNINNHTEKEASFIMPQISVGLQIHLLLEVRDNGSPQLVAYKRVIIEALKSDEEV
ncbi:DUF1593 domain-containing protein [Moorena bouillonii]|uniref:DUF1593 domain-containing protein n=1 Tax=Moorena bouillonii PNG TaxID=568701 RepID=A0A1U7N3F8_9CYAN|nr:DUF1593 domain-containing protein [Moorena bouillonii]OLT60492.1 hypothetical protein BJP37_17215 [Moorena bouillonii PNG]